MRSPSTAEKKKYIYPGDPMGKRTAVENRWNLPDWIPNVMQLAGLTVVLVNSAHAATLAVQQPTPQTASQPQQRVLQPTLEPTLKPAGLQPTLPRQQPNLQPVLQPAPQPTNQPQQEGLQQQPEEAGQPFRPMQADPPGPTSQPGQSPGNQLPSARGKQGINNLPNAKDRKPDQDKEGRERPRADAARIAQLAATDAARRTARTELFRDALSILTTNPNAADVEECKPGGSDDMCVPNAAASAPMHAATIQPVEIGRRVAYLIGNSKYRNGIPSLDTPAGDVEAIGKLLRKMRDYDVKIITNASKADIIRTLKLATRTTALHQSVLVMYAGHGYQIEETGQGYWIPVDATPNDPHGWVSNNDITKLLAAIPAKQIILISDSCFSGTLTKEQKMNIDGSTPRQDLLAKRSVLALTSGGEEPVSDAGRKGHSVFAATLIEQIEKLQSTNKSTTVGQMFEEVRAEVSRDFPQEPQLGAVNSAGHAPGGDYLIDVK